MKRIHGSRGPTPAAAAAGVAASSVTAAAGRGAEVASPASPASQISPAFPVFPASQRYWDYCRRRRCVGRVTPAGRSTSPSKQPGAERRGEQHERRWRHAGAKVTGATTTAATAARKPSVSFARMCRCSMACPMSCCGAWPRRSVDAHLRPVGLGLRAEGFGV